MKIKFCNHSLRNSYCQSLVCIKTGKNHTFFLIVFYWLVASPFSAFLGVGNQYESNYNAQSDTIVIASEPDYPPYCFIDKNGNAAGFAVELFKAAAAAAGLEVEIKIGIWNQIRQDLADGRIDALPFVGRTPEREDKFDFTMPYLSLHGAVFVRKNETGIQSFEDLKGKEIVVMKGDNAEEFVLRTQITDKVFTTNTFEEAFQELDAGLYDASIMQRITGLKLLEEMKAKNIKALNFQIPEFRQDFCFAVQEGNQNLLVRLNEGLSIVIANNTFEELRFKWFGPADEVLFSREKIIRSTLFIIIPVLVLGIVLWIVFLRKEVKRRTKYLNNEIKEHKKTLSALETQQKLYKESEKQIRLLLDSTAEGIYGIDKEGKCVMINQSGLKVLRYSDQEQVIGKNIHELIHHTKPDGTKCTQDECQIYKTFKEGTGTHSKDELFWRSDGSSFAAEYYSFPIWQNGNVTGSVITFWDITEEKNTENELIKLKDKLEEQVAQRTAELQEKVQKLDKSQKAMLYMVEDLNAITRELKNERRKLETANHELEAFSYSVSHDLRAPLRAINGFSKFLLEDYNDMLDNEGKRFIHTIRENASKMDRLITNLLNLSQVSRANLNITEVNMKNLATTVYKDISNKEEQSIFEFSISDMPVVNCDYGLMQQVWQNLIGNALKYSAKSEIKKIDIGANQNHNEIIFFIKDKGAGFNSNYKHKLFNAFQRLHHEYEFEGTGVGLAIVQRIVKLHGGKVWAEGEENSGAEFYFSLPGKIRTND